MLALILVAGIAFTQPTQQFDLVCEGTDRKVDRVLGTQEEPFEIRYRIDLARRVWCAADCRAVQPIEGITDTQLVLNDSHIERTTHSLTLLRTVDRMSGRFTVDMTMTVQGSPSHSLVTGTCQRAGFSGIPEQLF